MCLAVLALHELPHLPVLIAANRDEYHARPTAPAAPWDDGSDIVAGRDLQSGGTWMGMTQGGRYALVTNFRDPMRVLPDAPSRGDLVGDFLRGDETPAAYAARIDTIGARYNGYNLIVGDLTGAWYCSNRGAPARALAPGIYALSNHLLDTPWPKLARTKAAFTRLLQEHPQPDIEGLLLALADRSVAPDAELPDTGISLERERFLSSPFIVDPVYGTRSSSVMAIGESECLLYERRFAPDGNALDEVTLRYPLRTAV
ncbi:NRDE family protein [Bordetella sp. LUAb4]|uniref:NRDE family protein n=1 Tax=Bordetella sp. LUAb4 TaxID=2843195 RepID=UPI001E2CBC19|nr:NRDE family protein [Bordetella sp. LUAb4]